MISYSACFEININKFVCTVVINKNLHVLVKGHNSFSLSTIITYIKLFINKYYIIIIGNLGILKIVSIVNTNLNYNKL